MDGLRARRRAARASFLHSRAPSWAAQRPGIVARLRDLPTVLRLAAVVLLVVALARPQSTRADDDLEVEGIDIVIALDLSGSMEETDLVPNRLEAAKAVIQDFVRRRPTDRIGLVVFGREAYTYVPLTLDHGALLRMVAELRLGIIDGKGTAIGNGMGVGSTGWRRGAAALTEAAAAQRRRGAAIRAGTGEGPTSRSKVMILLTDGENNAGNISPEEAARLRPEAEGQGLHDPGRRQRHPDSAERARPGGQPPGEPQAARADRHHDGRHALPRQRHPGAGASGSRRSSRSSEGAPIHDRGMLYAELYPRFLLAGVRAAAAEIALRLTRLRRLP